MEVQKEEFETTLAGERNLQDVKEEELKNKEEEIKKYRDKARKGDEEVKQREEEIAMRD